MALELSSTGISLRKSSPRLIFDTDGATLISRHSDELAAYRTRKRWVTILNSYFLLEQGRDYEMSVLSAPENNYHVLNCFFTSACGRYAFWRLINDQAPEAESQLNDVGVLAKKKPGSSEPGSVSILWKTGARSEHAPWVLTGEQEEPKGSALERASRILPRIAKYFERFVK